MMSRTGGKCQIRENMDIAKISERIIDDVRGGVHREEWPAGTYLRREEAEALAAVGDLGALCAGADRIARELGGTRVDSCSIVNAKSGLCGEDCKWCAQSVRHHTGCDVYEMLDADRIMEAARHNSREGIRRFSLVTSGRALNDGEVDRFCEVVKRLSAETDLYLCASMGLLTEDQLRRLYAAGVRRYHCNLETSRGYFGQLCTTHDHDDKIATIRAAQKVGMGVCSGGIIGMGETMADRIDLAYEIASLGVLSTPMNILTPIPGTPLENVPLIGEEEIIRTAAVWRFILPRNVIRFAGGRMRVSHESMLKMLRGGVNGVLMGDMLTTVSNTIAQDRELFREAGMEFGA